MSDRREPIGVIGTGYVGLVTAAGFAELGSDVFCIDIDADKIARLQAGEIPIYEPGLAELVAAQPRPPALLDRTSPTRWSTRGCCSSPSARRRRTPATPTSAPCTRSSTRCPASDRHALVMKSTVPVGTGASIKRVLAEQRQGGLRATCPARSSSRRARRSRTSCIPTASSIGDDGDWAGDAVVELYAPLDAPLVRTDIASAEMVKLASNAFLATKISFINEIANVCEETGADVIEVARGMGLDDRIGQKFLQAGIGFGGSCFPKDVNALKQLAGNSGYHFQLLNAVIEVNELQKRRVIGKLQKHLGSLVGKTVALLGLAFKPNTDDMREASSLVLSARLQADGAAVRVYDPVAEDEARELIRGVHFAADALDAVQGADAVVLVTEWDEFLDLDWAQVAEAMAGTLVLDGRNALDAGDVRAAGLTYEGIGRGNADADRLMARADRCRR